MSILLFSSQETTCMLINCVPSSLKEVFVWRGCSIHTQITFTRHAASRSLVAQDNETTQQSSTVLAPRGHSLGLPDEPFSSSLGGEPSCQTSPSCLTSLLVLHWRAFSSNGEPSCQTSDEPSRPPASLLAKTFTLHYPRRAHSSTWDEPSHLTFTFYIYFNK